MSGEDGESAVEQDDVVQLGSARSRPRRWPKWVVFVGLLLGTVVALQIWQDASVPGSLDRPPGLGTVRTPESTVRTPAGESITGAKPSSVVMHSDLGGPLLGIIADWEVFGRGADVLVRVQPATGAVTQTTLPPLQSSGPVSLVVARDRTFIRPLDFVPGYLVPHGRPARRLTGVFNHAGPILPGPNPRLVWASAPQRSHTMTLLGLKGERTGITARVPSNGVALQDGSGYLMVTNEGGTYHVRPSRTRRITTGTVVAVGPTGWLAIECHRNGKCEHVFIDRVGLQRHAIPGPTSGPHEVMGLISPDGSTAAMLTNGPAGQSRLHLLDLDSGVISPITAIVQPRYAASSLAWSPDSRWLFVASGRLVAIHTPSAQVHDLGLPRSSIVQVAVRPPSF